jgi:hypothetical protein
MGSKKMASSGGDDQPLSASDFRTYNLLSERMEGFVGYHLWGYIFHLHSTNYHIAQSFPFNVESALGGM